MMNVECRWAGIVEPYCEKSHLRVHKGGKKTENEFTGEVRAVECEDCQIDAGSIHVSVLGLKGLVVKVEKGVVTVAKKSWLKRQGKNCIGAPRVAIKDEPINN